MNINRLVIEDDCMTQATLHVTFHIYRLHLHLHCSEKRSISFKSKSCYSSFLRKGFQGTQEIQVHLLSFVAGKTSPFHTKLCYKSM